MEQRYFKVCRFNGILVTRTISLLAGLWTLSLCLTHQYHVVYDQMNWTDAQQHCRDKFTDLVTVYTIEDVRTLNSMVDVNRMERFKAVWIGLYKDVEVKWRWSDGNSSPFRRWGTGEPNGGRDQCGVHYINSYWADWRCSNKLSFICYSNVLNTTMLGRKQLLRVKLNIDSSLDVTGPAISDAILEQLKQNMKTHQGAPADIKVRWMEQADGRIFHKEGKKKMEKKKGETKPVLTKRKL